MLIMRKRKEKEEIQWLYKEWLLFQLSATDFKNTTLRLRYRNRSNFMTAFAFPVSFPYHDLFNKWQVLNRAPEEGPWEQLNNLSRNAFSESLSCIFCIFIFHRFNGRSNRKLYQFVQNDRWRSDVRICYSLCIDFHQQEKVFKSV